MTRKNFLLPAIVMPNLVYTYVDILTLKYANCEAQKLLNNHLHVWYYTETNTTYSGCRFIVIFKILTKFNRDFKETTF